MVLTKHSGSIDLSDTKKWLKPDSHLCYKHNTSEISISIRKRNVSFFVLMLIYAYFTCQFYAYRLSVTKALGLKNREKYKHVR